MDSIEPVKHLINIGDIQNAKRALGKIVYTDPSNPEAWLLLASILDDPDQQADCYRQVLQHVPDNQEARQRLLSLTMDQAPPKLHSEKVSGLSNDQNETESDASISEFRKLVEDYQPIETFVDIPEDELDEDVIKGQEKSKVTSDPDRGSESYPPDVENDQTSDLLFLGPTSIVNLAGGPLPEDERRQCPKCSATISRRETRCPWCSTPLNQQQ